MVDLFIMVRKITNFDMTGRLDRYNSLTYLMLQLNTIQSTITSDTSSAFIEENKYGATFVIY
jgi:hypothetical protein